MKQPKLTFDQWFTIVSKIMNDLCGMGPDDLPDYLYHQAYDNKVSPDRAARAAIKAAKKGY